MHQETIQEMDSLFSQAFAPDALQGQMRLLWEQTKAPFILPLMKFMVYLCMAMSIMLFLDRVYMGLLLFVKLLRRKPEKRYKWEAIREDLELGNSAYPMVLVQIPIYNDNEVYQLSIGAACGLSWLSDGIIVQVLDDSTDADCKDTVELECRRWASKGININYEIRDNSNGYNAKKGMKNSYVMPCDHVAIFDADFQPEPDFLWRTIPFLVHDPEIALVQALWKFRES